MSINYRQGPCAILYPLLLSSASVSHTEPKLPVQFHLLIFEICLCTECISVTLGIRVTVCMNCCILFESSCEQI